MFCEWSSAILFRFELMSMDCCFFFSFSCSLHNIYYMGHWSVNYTLYSPKYHIGF